MTTVCSVLQLPDTHEIPSPPSLVKKTLVVGIPYQRHCSQQPPQLSRVSHQLGVGTIKFLYNNKSVNEFDMYTFVLCCVGIIAEDLRLVASN